MTGAAGFIGRACCERLAMQGAAVRRLTRAPALDGIAVDLARASTADLTQALAGVHTIVHLAGRAHVAGETAERFDAVYREANELATRRLAERAVAAGVSRFIFASTIKVNGESTPPGRPFQPADVAAPYDAYARSKLAAETALFDAARGTSMDAVALRLPLVYGPGAKGNWRVLIDAVRERRWLPVGAIGNRRSLLGLENLLDALAAAIAAPSALRGVHFVTDRASVSTPDLVRAVAAALGVAPRIASVPVPVLQVAGLLTGRREVIARLAGSLEADPSSFAAASGWTPRPLSIDAATVAR